MTRFSALWMTFWVSSEMASSVSSSRLSSSAKISRSTSAKSSVLASVWVCCRAIAIWAATAAAIRSCTGWKACTFRLSAFRTPTAAPRMRIGVASRLRIRAPR